MAHSSTALLTPQRIKPGAKDVWLALISVVAVFFIVKYAIRYYYLRDVPGQTGLTWFRHLVLVTHISGGMVALLVGPWQFSGALRRRYLRVHRVMGRIYLVSVGVASVAALQLAMTTIYGCAWGFGVGMLTVVWLSTSGIAFYAVLHRQIKAHQEWMRRSYIATFAFATVRLLTDTPPLNRLEPAHDAMIVAIWVCWVVPMFALEVVVQIRKLREQALVP
jgi:uncharacterized membrane protein